MEKSVEETLSYMGFPYEHWIRLRTNTGLERIMKEIRRRTRVVGSFPDGYSAMMLGRGKTQASFNNIMGYTSVYEHVQPLWGGCKVKDRRRSLTNRACSSEALWSVGL